MDESIEASDTAQLAIFIRGIDEKYNITEEMISVVLLKDTTKSIDLFDALKTTMKRFSLSMKNLSDIITDGAPTMVGKNGGLVKMVNSEAVAAGNTILMAYNCIVHLGILRGKF
ncbi:general transcription factor II-I repeat domain-containing protein 2 [Trichonephila clavata]|uniref:General transcription factor II-I repeat domain-containing protein 2 n=1 Tax=Trichonephila clavata TaxID=2740835 RepID=A0A8X6H4M6_TRICU|nr:general transcription factor II-I repeat domain-containing protein 2 [Trichonephila clavata]